MAQLAQEAEVSQQIQKVLKQSVSKKEKKSLIKSIKKSSIAQTGKATSLQTIISVSNSMVGTSTLVFPVLFCQSGIGLGIMIAIIIGLISCRTTQLLIVHNKSDEMDLPDTLQRVLGAKWKTIFNISNVILLWASGIIYMILICNQLYPLIQIICDNIGIKSAQLTEITLSKLSYQWVGIGYTLFILPMFFQKKLGIILQLLPYGIISVFSFILFTIYEGIYMLITDHQGVVDNLKWFSWDVSTMAGTFALALLIQSMVVPIMKNNMIQQNNNRDIAIGFTWTWFVYCMAGTFGAFAVAGALANNQKQDGKSGSTLLDYYPSDNPLVIVIQVLLFLQLTLVFPVLQFITRSQFFGLIYELERQPKWQFYAFSLTYAITCLIVQCVEVDLSLIISLCGAVIGLFQEYIIPIALHLNCLYAKKGFQTQNQPNYNQVQVSMESTQYLVDQVDFTKFSLNDEEDLKCNDHQELLKRMPKNLRISLYSFILIIGIAIGIGKLIDIFK
ncbi:unnamed protein product [Paramecium pentaurelia]|uniref:Amino acid transporter transmembrane domain-containing protein n=1 Tax=Paramecium pentaurelia TaxID=43138 RepID=A0A8S1WLK8_9CILI|nr:unnamed protein product [Paramecium pentaurelia]